MNLNQFVEKVSSIISDRIGKDCVTEMKDVRKNNGVVYHGLLIHCGQRNVIPTIYLDPFFEAYENGVSLSEIIDNIMRLYEQETPGDNIDMNFFLDYEKVRDRICYKVINIEKNKELLSDIPYVEFLDLAICFFYSYTCPPIGEGSILIHNSHMEKWGIKVKDLMHAANNNSPILYPLQLCGIEEMLDEMGYQFEEYHENIPMYILTNNRRTQGAACMIYPNALGKISTQFDRGFYIFPSSVHEVILFDSEAVNMSPERMKEMIVEINRTNLEAEEVLSDSLYFYDKKDRIIKKIL